MHENRDQPEQDPTKVNPSRIGSQEEPSPSADSGYEETHIPYLPLPDIPPQQKSVSAGSDHMQEAAPLSSSQPTSTAEPKMHGGAVLLGAIFGALLGGVLSVVTKGSLLQWGGLGAVGGAVLALLVPLLSEGDWPFLLDFGGLEVALSSALDCCSISLLLLLIPVITVGGLLLGHNLLLAAEVGASLLVLILIRMSFALLKSVSQGVQQGKGEQAL
jgi:hypothetical protein